MDSEPSSITSPPPQANSQVRMVDLNIGWRTLILGTIVLLAIYFLGFASNFPSPSTANGAYIAGYVLATLLLIPVGAAIGTPIWLIAWLLKRRRISFKLFVLLGMAVFLVCGVAGKRYVVSQPRAGTLAANPVNRAHIATTTDLSGLTSRPIESRPTQSAKNSLVAEYRAKNPNDLRENRELIAIFGALNDKDGRFAGYPDFLQDYELLKEEKAIELTRTANTYDPSENNEQVVRSWLSKMTGDLKVTGWDAINYGNGAYLVRYNFTRDGETRAWYFDVNMTAEIVRDVAQDDSLRKKYGFKTSQ